MAEKKLTEERLWEILQTIAWEVDGYPESNAQGAVSRAKIIIKERDEKASNENHD